MTYVVLAPIYWKPFDPPVASTDTPLSGVPLSQMFVGIGLVQGDGLKRILGDDLFDALVNTRYLEPIP